MWKYFTHRETLTYIDVLSEMVTSYSHIVHRTICIPPTEVTWANQTVSVLALFLPTMGWSVSVLSILQRVSHTSLCRMVGPFINGNKVLSDVHEGKRCLDRHEIVVSDMVSPIYCRVHRHKTSCRWQPRWSTFSRLNEPMRGNRFLELTEWTESKRVDLRFWKDGTVPTKEGVSLHSSGLPSARCLVPMDSVRCLGLLASVQYLQLVASVQHLVLPERC
jgi:hypothetical protein